MKFFIFNALFLTLNLAHAQHESHGQHVTSTDQCNGGTWNYSMSMCMPLARDGKDVKMTMFHFNSFLVQNIQEKPRGTNGFSVPNMFMLDSGFSKGNHFLNVNVMATLELWTFPKSGYPELLQVGEENKNHEPYVDAQHPHSSPIMGLTFSDTISFGEGEDHLKIFVAPRGEATEGPIAFMHRPTGMINPDAPLGHHVGQDSGHITSTVLGFSLRLNNTTIQSSAFNGTEPEPTKVDLPVGNLNSHAFRLIQEFSENFYAMASYSYVKEPESHSSMIDHVDRYSASIYNSFNFDDGLNFKNTFIWGQANYDDNTLILNSFGEEFLLSSDKNTYWGRIEYLQRTPAELLINANDPLKPEWVTALTLGYTYKLSGGTYGQLGLGGAITQNYLPVVFQEAYGKHPLSGKLFVQISGMNLFGLGD